MWPGQFIGFKRERLLALVRLDEEHVLPVVVVVTRRDVASGRRRGAASSPRRSRACRFSRRRRSSSAFQSTIPFGCQNGDPGEWSREMEEVELRSEPAMVARARLLEPLEVRVEVGLGVERGAVDPRELRVVLVAAPVRAGEARQLDRLDRRRALEVRAAAEIGERALRVERDGALGVAGELDLVRLPFRLEARDRLLAGELLARPLAPLARSRGGSPLRSPPGRSSEIGSGNSKS